MKILKTLLVTALAINVSLLAPQLSAATMSDKEARADFQKKLDHARQLLDDGQWKSLATEAQELLDTSKSIERRSGETKKEHNKMRHAIKKHATGLATAARDENRAEATEHYNELAACFQTKANRGDLAVDNTGRNVRDRDGKTLTPMDQGESKADLKATQKLRKAIVGYDSLSVNAKNVKIITVDGIMTLRGVVNSKEEKANIAAKAGQIDGVVKVKNRLEVKNS